MLSSLWMSSVAINAFNAAMPAATISGVTSIGGTPVCSPVLSRALSVSLVAMLSQVYTSRFLREVFPGRISRPYRIIGDLHDIRKSEGKVRFHCVSGPESPESPVFAMSFCARCRAFSSNSLLSHFP